MGDPSSSIREAPKLAIISSSEAHKGSDSEIDVVDVDWLKGAITSAEGVEDLDLDREGRLITEANPSFRMLARDSLTAALKLTAESDTCSRSLFVQYPQMVLQNSVPLDRRWAVRGFSHGQDGSVCQSRQ
jgi:hypothetical protein